MKCSLLAKRCSLRVVCVYKSDVSSPFAGHQPTASHSETHNPVAMSVPVALILGAGSNIGSGVARAFAAKGYKIALVARKAEEDKSTANEVHIKGDFANPESLAQVFDKVRSKVGLPHVVVYNGERLQHLLVMYLI